MRDRKLMLETKAGGKGRVAKWRSGTGSLLRLKECQHVYAEGKYSEEGKIGR